MLNVANLYPAPFAAILDGTKTVENRLRRHLDARLDAIQPGEWIVFLECGSDRAIACHVEQVTRERNGTGPLLPTDPVLHYRIFLSTHRFLFRASIRKLQGWHRRPTLWSHAR